MLHPFVYRVWLAESALQHELCASHFLTTECDAYENEFYLFFRVRHSSVTVLPHRPVPVHIEEFSMTFQDRHETGLHEGLVNIALNGQAFKTHGRRPRKSSLSCFSHILYNRILLKFKNLGVRHQILDQGLVILPRITREENAHCHAIVAMVEKTKSWLSWKL